MITLAVYTALVLALGPNPKLLVSLPIQVAFGWWQLTSANYIEHYGLLRQKMADGRYERAQPRHSWNSTPIASNLILFHLQRHSDHPAQERKRVVEGTRCSRRVNSGGRWNNKQKNKSSN